MNSSEIITILKNIKIFDGMSEQHLEAMMKLARPLLCPTDTVIIDEGTRGESMYIIKSGSVKITRSQDVDEEIFIGLLDEGAYFGEMSLIDNLPRSASVISLEDTEIFQLNKKDFDRLLAGNNDIAIIFYRNCLRETFLRSRNALSSFTFSQHNLREKSEQLEEINRDLSVAQQIQSVFINSEYLESSECLHENVRHSFVYHPCIEVGGDFMNIVKLDDDLISVIIADVEGHGVTAALATGILKSAFSLLSKELGTRPSELMTELNIHFSEVLSRRLFATCYYALINTAENKITAVKAGHHHPLFWKVKEQSFLKMESSGPGLGIITDAVFEEKEYEFETGDKIIFYTDGIIEQLNEKHEMYLHKRMKEKTRKLIVEGETRLLNILHDDVLRFAHGVPIEDDITLLMLEFN